MKVLVIGSGGREHALAYTLARDAQVFGAPGNPGIAQCGTCVDLSTLQDTIEFCKHHAIDLVVVGPEQPLIDGLADDLRKAGITVFGPSAAAARLEGSKAFMKEVCAEADVPTASYQVYDRHQDARNALKSAAYPVVIKADGLAAGKGVFICQNLAEAHAVVEDCMVHKVFGASGSRVVIETFLQGQEVSVFALLDGTGQVLALPSAQDHKRVGDGDTGLNTGGMGAYSPVPLMTPALTEQVIETIIRPIDQTLRTRGCPYCGVLFAGLMITSEGPVVLEFNIRFGDPEAQVILPRLQTNMPQLLLACAQGRLAQIPPPVITSASQVCVIMASRGYPGSYEKGQVIAGIEEAQGLDGITVFHAGTRAQGAQLVNHGGRVLAISAQGSDVHAARDRAYEAIGLIDWPEGFYRCDIGWQYELSQEKNAS